MTGENSLTINLATVTPIWTGGTDGKSDRLHITGIMGTLRWWYEVMVRSVGGTACDPTKHRCLYDQNKPNDGLCDVCRIFGATGWARRFKLTVIEAKLEQKQPQASTPKGQGILQFTLSQDHPSFPKPKWYLPGKPLYGNVELRITATAPLDKSSDYLDPKVIGALIQFIADWGGIGAKPQLGLGVVHLAERQSLLPLIEHLKQIVARHQQNNDFEPIDENLPCLQNMFFATVKVGSATASDTFDIKHDLRKMFRQDFGNNDLRHTIMGYVGRIGREQVRIGSKIMMSYPYNGGTIRIWGWIPESFSSHVSSKGESILEAIYGCLVETYGEKNAEGKLYIPWLDYESQKAENALQYLEDYFLKIIEREQENA